MTKPARIAPTPPWRETRLRRAFAATVFLAMALSSIGIGAPPAATQLDPSWSAVLSWAFANGAQFGKQVVFTYGPLGFLYPSASSHPATYPLFLAGQALIALLAAYPIAALATRMRLAAYVPILATWAFWWPWLQGDALWFMYFATGAVLLTNVPPGAGERPLWPHAVAIGIGSASFALVKFSLFPLSIVFVFLMALAAGSRRDPRLALALVGSYCGTVLLLWLSAGQALANLPAYVRNSLEVATGYGSAMGLDPAPLVDLIGTSMALIALGWLLVQALLRRRQPHLALGLVAQACVAFFGWKAGFTRADPIHIAWSLPVLCAALPLGLGLVRSVNPESLHRPDFVLAAINGALAIVLIDGSYADAWRNRMAVVLETIPGYLHAPRLIDRQARDWEDTRQRFQLPETMRLVGRGSVDVVSWEQGVVLLNGLNYQPRPVFQSYSAYTPRLAALNQTYFTSPHRPDWVLLKVQSIDGRLPAGEDGTALLTILATYQLRAREHGYLLMSNLAEPARGREVAQALAMETGAINEWIEVPLPRDGEGIVARLETDSSLQGRMRGFFWRGAELSIDLMMENGEVRGYRLIPGATETGFLLSPLVDSNDELLRLLTSAGGNPVRRFRLRPALAFQQELFEPRFRYGFGRLRFPAAGLDPHASSSRAPSAPRVRTVD